MNIVKDFNDIKIVVHNNNTQTTLINFDFFISRTVDALSLATFFNYNTYFCNEYIKEKYQMQFNFENNFKIITFDSFYKVRLEIKFASKAEFKHLQPLRDYLYLSIVGVENQKVLDKMWLLNLGLYSQKCLKGKRLKSSNFVEDIMLKNAAIDMQGFNLQIEEKLNQCSAREIAKKYIKARADVFNFMFQKNMFVITPFDNFSGFFDSLFTQINASYQKVSYNSSNVNLRAINKLIKKDKKGIIFSLNAHYDMVIQEICTKMFSDASELFFQHLKDNDSNFKFEKFNLDKCSFIYLLNDYKMITLQFKLYFNKFVSANLNSYISSYQKYICTLIKNKDFLEILHLCQYANIEITDFEQSLQALQNKITNINSNDISSKLIFKKF